MSRVGGVGHNPTCPPQGPGGMQVMEGWQTAANHPLTLSSVGRLISDEPDEGGVICKLVGV